MDSDKYRVLLPDRLKQQASSKEEYKELVLRYMESYPHYQIIAIKNGFAICVRR
jgi:hypothetical protein